MSASTALTNAQPSSAVATSGGKGGGANHAGAPAGPAVSKKAAASEPAKVGGTLLGSDTVLPLMMVVILGLMLLPLPPVLLDLLLALSLALSLVVFLFSLHIERPLQFSSFPSVLLLLTLFRLALNIGSTRLILTRGNEGEAAAGQVIRAFGEFVVGGNTVVGIILFLILVVINFVVITKGAGRIAEVAARFTLDAMPGKQMAIDADLAAGLIAEQEARSRRQAVEREADFFGSMDGASKFVRGDAVAGLVITGVNIVGGFIVGVWQQDMAAGEAVTSYTSLTVGDGLVSQIPALLTSIAAGFVATRASVGGSLAPAVRSQLFGARKPVAVAAVVLGLLAVVPGMPHLAFLGLSGALGLAAWRLKKPQEATPEVGEQLPEVEAERVEIESMLPLDLLEMEVGYEVVNLVDSSRDGSLLKRIAGVRKQMAQDLGILVPPIHLRDNLRLGPGEYRILLSGAEIGRGELRIGKLLTMDPGGGAPELPGDETIEPAFGLRAKWIVPSERERAELSGYTVVDAATVAATHLGELLGKNAHQLLGRREIQELLDLHGRENSRVIEELIPGELSMAGVIRVLRNLLRERVSIRDFRSILEALADNAALTKDPDELTERVRQRLGRQITAQHIDALGRLHALVLSPGVEGLFRRLQQPNAGGILDPGAVQRLLEQFERGVQVGQAVSEMPVVISAADIRRSVATFVARHLPQISVLSFRELDADVALQTVGVIGEQAAREVGR